MTSAGVISVSGWRVWRVRKAEVSPRPERPTARTGDGVLEDGQQAPCHQLRGLEECCKLAQLGPGRSAGKMWFLCISGLEKSTNLDISQLVDRFQVLDLYKRISFHNRYRPLQHPLNDGISRRGSVYAVYGREKMSPNITMHQLVTHKNQWRNNGVGRVGKVQGAPSFRPKILKIIFLLQ